MESPVQEGELLAGKYRVEKVLGEGGMGIVVSAFRGDLEQRVAVKFLTSAAAERPESAERFRREARAAAKIRSEHVARVLDVGTLDNGLPYMVMEYLEGNDIADELRKCGVLPILDAIDFTLQAIEALAEAHASGVVHRDLKPGNIFLAQRADGTRRVKVLDFGISKALSGTSLEELSLTKTSALIGSPLYMAPEQMRSAKDVDTRADIWSLGAMLYEMLTGQPPYTGESIPQLCAALLHDDPVPLRDLRGEIPALLEQAVLRCLAKDRAHRFPNVFELGRALLPFGQAESRVHVERAERVLGARDVTLSHDSPHTDRSSAPALSAPLVITPLGGSSMPVADPTVNSWGQPALQKPAPPKRLRMLLGVGLGAAVLAGVAGLLVARLGATPAEAPMSPPAASTLPAPLGQAADVEAAAAVAPHTAVPAPAIAPASASAVPMPIAAAPATVTPAARVRPGAVTQPKSGAKGQPGKAEPAITDFGGRR